MADALAQLSGTILYLSIWFDARTPRWCPSGWLPVRLFVNSRPSARTGSRPSWGSPFRVDRERNLGTTCHRRTSRSGLHAEAGRSSRIGATHHAYIWLSRRVIQIHGGGCDVLFILVGDHLENVVSPTARCRLELFV